MKVLYTCLGPTPVGSNRQAQNDEACCPTDQLLGLNALIIYYQSHPTVRGVESVLPAVTEKTGKN
jgi:hypothetical protein